MYKLVLVRHGQSEWNEKNLFTGWTDVDLTERGKNEAREAGKSLKEAGFQFRYVYTSLLKRAIKTLDILLEEMDLMWLPVEKSWRLNEKHYGFLQGMNKTEMVEKYGVEQVHQWRRSFDIRPPAIPTDDPRHPKNDVRYQLVKEKGSTPGTESLMDCTNRIIPLWNSSIYDNLKLHNQVLIVAHGNSLRGIIKFIKNISKEEIIDLNIPTGIPYVFEFDEDMNFIRDYFMADENTLKKMMEEVANQTKKK